MKISRLALPIIIFFFAFIVRFLLIGEVPAGLSQDETSIGFNAYSILKTGRDEYGRRFPAAFKAFGEYKLPGYIYLSVPTVAAYGTTPIGVRLPSAIFGFGTVVIFYFFVRSLTKNETLALISTVSIALNPWHIHFSRAAFEVVPALFFMTLGAYLFIKFVDLKNHTLLAVSFVFFVLSMYTYNICRVLAPVLFLGLFYIYRDKVNIRGARTWLSITPGLIILIPFLTSIFSPGGASSASGTLVHSSAVTQANLIETRSYILEGNSAVAKLFFNKWVLTIFEYLKNIVSYFSVQFLFISGSSHGNHGIGNVGMFYLFEMVTVAAGILALIKKQEKWLVVIVLWMAAAILVAAYTREAPHGTRGFFLIPPLVLISSYGAYYLYENFGRMKGRLFRIVLILGFILVGFNIIYYFSSYYLRFPTLYAASWRSEDQALVSYIFENESKYDKIIFDQDSPFIYTSLLYYSAYSPSEFSSDVVRTPDDSEGFNRVLRFGKYEFGKIELAGDTVGKKLIVTIPKNVPQNAPILKTFNYPRRPVVIAQGQRILAYPTSDVAYVLFEKE